MLCQSNEIGQLQGSLLSHNKDINEIRALTKSSEDYAKQQINEIKKNYQKLLLDNPAFMIAKRPDWYNEANRKDTEVDWYVAGSSPARKVRCFGGNITVHPTITYRNAAGTGTTLDYYVPVFMITNRYDDQWSNIVNCPDPWNNPFYSVKKTVYTVRELLKGCFDAWDGIYWSRVDLSNIVDFYCYRFFLFDFK